VLARFAQVADALSAPAVAEQAGITAEAVWWSVRSLTTIVGTPLFRQLTNVKPLELTDLGEALRDQYRAWQQPAGGLTVAPSSPNSGRRCVTSAASGKRSSSDGVDVESESLTAWLEVAAA
jgi:DNA-binding transcriptional LysR family regulator